LNAAVGCGVEVVGQCAGCAGESGRADEAIGLTGIAQII